MKKLLLIPVAVIAWVYGEVILWYVLKAILPLLELFVKGMEAIPDALGGLLIVLVVLSAVIFGVLKFVRFVKR